MRTRPVFVSGLVLALVVVGWLLATGVGLAAALLVTAALALQTVTGGFIWAWVRGRSGGSASSLEILAVGFALGSFLAMAAGVLLRPVVPGGFGWAAPSVIVVGIYLFGLRGRRQRGAGTHPKIDWPGRSALLGLLLGCGIGLAGVLVNLTRYPLQWSGLWDGYHPDMLFFEGLATGLARFGPGESIFMVGADLRYHWFAYAWIGQLSDSLGLEPFIGLTRVLPLVTVVGSVALAVSWAARHSKQVWVPSLAAVLIAAGGYLGATYGTLLNFDSPSQAMTTVWLLALSFVLLEYLASEVGARALWLIGALGVACVGGKASAAIVAIGAMAITWVVGLLRRCAWWRRALIAFAVLAGPGLLAYLLVLTGSDGSGGLQLLTWANRASTVQGLDFGSSGLGVAAGTIMLMLAVLPRWLGLVGFWIDPVTRWSPPSLFGLGLVALALAPLLLLSQGVNELWFALSASAPLAVISAIGLGVAWTVVRRQDTPQVLKYSSLVIGIGAGGLVTFLVASLIWAQGETASVSVRALGPMIAVAVAALISLVLMGVFGARYAGSRGALALTIFISALVIAAGVARLSPLLKPFQIGIPVDQVSAEFSSPESGLQGATSNEDAGWTDLDVAAAEFLKANSTESDVVITDRTFSAVVPALTGLRSFIAGAPYQGLYGRTVDVADIPGRMVTAESFARAPASTEFESLCADGVTWGWFTNYPAAEPVAWAPFATIAYQNATVTVVKLDRQGCPTS